MKEVFARGMGAISFSFFLKKEKIKRTARPVGRAQIKIIVLVE